VCVGVRDLKVPTYMSKRHAVMQHEETGVGLRILR